MKVLTIQEANEEYKIEMLKLKEQYGDWSFIPRDKTNFLGEKCRLMAGIAINPNWKVEEVISYYSIDKRVAVEMLGVEEDALLIRKAMKRADKYDILRKWIAENTFAQVNPNELAEIGELSYQTVLKFISDNPNTFRKLQRGKYEIRDEKADREAEK